MKNHNSVENLRAALSALESLDALDLVGEFRAFEHGCAPGTYCALVLDPRDGTTNTVNEASWSCSADEYFGESGVLSRETLISATRAHWSPSPDDGFEWDDKDDYVHPAGDYAGWITAEAFADLDEEDQAKYTEWFSVSDRPVDGWVPDGWSDHDVKDIDKQLADLREAIEAEIAAAEEVTA